VDPLSEIRKAPERAISTPKRARPSAAEPVYLSTRPESGDKVKRATNPMKNFLIFAAFGAFLWAQAPFTSPAAGAPKSNTNPEIAVVDGHSVTVNDVRQMMESAPPQFVQALKQNPQLAIRDFYVLKYLSIEGDKAKLAEESPLKEQLEMLRAQTLAIAMVNHERDGYTVSEDMIKSFYERNKSRYEQAKVKIIFIAYKPGLANSASCKTPEECARQALEAAHPKNERSEAEAKTIADDISRQLKAGAKFEDMVTKYSDDEDSKKVGGDLGKPVTSTSPYPDDVKKAIFALKPGEISNPVRQPNGFYLIRLEEKTAQPMDQVMEPIVQEIRQSHLNDFMNGLNRRFQPAVKNTEFFLKPDTFLSAPAK
jgi:peptidyl-prolyl cis-trans isomerase C